MQQITYVPPGGSYEDPERRVDLALAPPYIIGTLSGTGGPELTVLSSTAPGVAGVLSGGIHVEPREISCTIHERGNDRRGMYENRFRLIQMLAPYEDEGMLYYANDYITLRISARPLNAPEFTARLCHYNQAELRFWCPFPYWESLTEQSSQMAYLDEGFTFPFSFDISFASMQNKAAVLNSGSVPAPLEITIRGPATNPAVINDTTGEQIKIFHTIAEGELLKINTRQGKKSVRIESGGIEKDAFHYIDPQSSFFQLQPGENLLRYSSEDETEPTQVLVRFRELYAGV